MILFCRRKKRQHPTISVGFFILTTYLQASSSDKTKTLEKIPDVFCLSGNWNIWPESLLSMLTLTTHTFHTAIQLLPSTQTIICSTSSNPVHHRHSRIQFIVNYNRFILAMLPHPSLQQAISTIFETMQD